MYSHASTVYFCNSTYICLLDDNVALELFNSSVTLETLCKRCVADAVFCFPGTNYLQNGKTLDSPDTKHYHVQKVFTNFMFVYNLQLRQMKSY